MNLTVIANAGNKYPDCMLQHLLQIGVPNYEGLCTEVFQSVSQIWSLNDCACRFIELAICLYRLTHWIERGARKPKQGVPTSRYFNR